METTAKLPDTNLYWNTLKNLSDDIKLELIAKLSNSLLHSKKKEKEYSASHFYGVWKDDDYEDADRMVE